MDAVAPPQLFKLELSYEVSEGLDNKTIKELIGIFYKLLQTEPIKIRQAFITNNWSELRRLAENLLSAAMFFNVPHLQEALRETLLAITRKTITMATVNKVNYEVGLLIGEMVT